MNAQGSNSPALRRLVQQPYEHGFSCMQGRGSLLGSQMAKAGNGAYFKIAHELWNHPVYDRLTCQQFRVMITLIHLANWKSSRVIGRDGVEFEISRGEMIYTQEQIGAASRTKRQVVRGTLAILEKIGFLNQTTNHGLSVITICNYSKWQDVKSEHNQTDNQPTTSRQPYQKHLKQEKQEKNYTLRVLSIHAPNLLVVFLTTFQVGKSPRIGWIT